MKNLFLIFVLFQLFIYTPLQAQPKKGTMLIGTSSNLLGNLNQFGSNGISNNAGIQFGKIKTEYTFSSGNSIESEISVTSFNLSPFIGGFVSDHFLIGASAGFFFYQIKDDDDKSGFTALSFSPFVRGYLKKEGKTLPYAEARGGWNSIKNKGQDESETIPFLGAKVGAAIFLNPNISLDLFADYLYAWDKEETGTGLKIVEKQGLFGLGVGLSVFLSKQDANED
jgi:hypothetical protein